ncbi:MAG TPA: glycosyltransferase family 39 protein [Terriglobales bacterium]
MVAATVGISGVACIPLLYVVGTRIESQRAGIASALLFAINVTAIAYSQEARSYSLLLLLCLVSLLCFFRIRTGSTSAILIYALVSALAVYAHFFAIFFLLAQWLSVLSQPASGIRELPWRKYLAAIFLTTCLISPALYYMAFRRTGQLAYITRPHLHDLAQLLYFLTADGGRFRKPIALLYLFCCGAGVRRLILRLRTRDSSPQNTGQILIIFCAVLPIVLTFLISFWVPIFFPRYLLICLPPVVLLAGSGLAGFPSWARSGLVLVMIGLSAGCVIWYYGHPNDDWRSLAAYVLKYAEPGDIIVGCPPGAEWPVQYYSAAMNSGKPPQFSYLTAPRLLQKLHSANNSALRFWVVAWGDKSGR